MNERRGLWIGLDGPDFTGKKTQVKFLVKTLLDWSEDNIIAVTHEPSRRAGEIKKTLAEDPEPYSNGMRLLKLYTDDRVITQNTISYPVLAAGGIVIANRHKPSTDAFQSAQGVPILITMATQRQKEIGTPDISFYLVASGKDVRERMQKSLAKKERDVNLLDKFEKDLNFQMKVAEQYKIMAQMAPRNSEYFGEVHLINADPAPEVVAANITSLLKPKYDKWLAGLHYQNP